MLHAFDAFFFDDKNLIGEKQSAILKARQFCEEKKEKKTLSNRGEKEINFP